MGKLIYAIGMLIVGGSLFGMYFASSALWISVGMIGAFTCYMGGVINGENL